MAAACQALDLHAGHILDQELEDADTEFVLKTCQCLATNEIDQINLLLCDPVLSDVTLLNICLDIKAGIPASDVIFLYQRIRDERKKHNNEPNVVEEIRLHEYFRIANTAIKEYVKRQVPLEYQDFCNSEHTRWLSATNKEELVFADFYVFTYNRWNSLWRVRKELYNDKFAPWVSIDWFLEKCKDSNNNVYRWGWFLEQSRLYKVANIIADHTYMPAYDCTGKARKGHEDRRFKKILARLEAIRHLQRNIYVEEIIYVNLDKILRHPNPDLFEAHIEQPHDCANSICICNSEILLQCLKTTEYKHNHSEEYLKDAQFIVDVIKDQDPQLEDEHFDWVFITTHGEKYYNRSPKQFPYEEISRHVENLDWVKSDILGLTEESLRQERNQKDRERTIVLNKRYNNGSY